MPDYGTLSLAAVQDRPPVEADGDTAAWELENVRVISLTFEVAKAQMLDLLPSPLIRPVPPYAKVIVVDAPVSLVGPYREASLFLGAREGVQIRNVLVDSIVAGEQQLAEARRRFGGSRRGGEVTLTAGEQEISATVSDAGGALCELHMSRLQPCDATMLKFDALQVVGTVNGEPALLRYGLRVPLTEVEGTLSREWQVRMLRRGTAWQRLRPAYNVTAFATFGAARLEFAHLPSRANPPGLR